jgi:hypothetical protein
MNTATEQKTVEITCPDGHHTTSTVADIDELSDIQNNPIKCPHPGCKQIAQVQVQA